MQMLYYIIFFFFFFLKKKKVSAVYFCEFVLGVFISVPREIFYRMISFFYAHTLLRITQTRRSSNILDQVKAPMFN
jgi:predicted membrane protein